MKYSNIASFGKKISFGGKYLAVSSDNANFVYLFILWEDSFEFVTHLVLPTNKSNSNLLGYRRLLCGTITISYEMNKII